MDVEDILGGSGCRKGLWVKVVLVDLVEEYLRGVGIVDGLDLAR